MSGQTPPYIVSWLMALHTGAELTSVHVFTPPCAGSTPLKQRSMVASDTALDLMMLGVTYEGLEPPVARSGSRQPHSACSGTLGVPLLAMMEQLATAQSTNGPLHLGHSLNGAVGVQCVCAGWQRQAAQHARGVVSRQTWRPCVNPSVLNTHLRP
jgi:hypothetical protein